MKNQKITSQDFEAEKSQNESNVNQDKETKKKSNAQKAMPWMIVVIVSLLVILTCVLIAYYQVYKVGKQNANILEGVYASSYFGMVDNVNNLSVDISKYSTLTTRQAKLSTIQDMMTDCNYILAGLSVLPIDQENVSSATKFFNQVNGVCEAYATQLNKGNDLTREQELLFDKIGLVVGEIKNNFNMQNQGMYDTNYNFVDATMFDNTGMNELSAGMGDLTSSSVDYPSMIFDGPFSSALETKNVKGLPEKESSKDEAYDYLRNTVYKNRDDILIKYQGDTEGDLATYNYELDIDDKKFIAQVSKRGLLLITLSGYAEGGDPIMKVEQAEDLAVIFANNIGFESMDSVWKEVNENVAYINLAPIKNGVIYYPDLVKVKVDMTAQDIIGFEAVNYALNHVDRNLNFDLNLEEVEPVLGFDYEILKTSKALIRLDGGREVSTYEYFVERIDGYYFYYINANSGEIEKTMKLVTIKNIEKLI